MNSVNNLVETYSSAEHESSGIVMRLLSGIKGLILPPASFPKTLVFKVENNPYTLRGSFEISKFNAVLMEQDGQPIHADYTCATGMLRLLSIRSATETSAVLCGNVRYEGQDLKVELFEVAEGGYFDLILTGDPAAVAKLGDDLCAFYEDLRLKCLDYLRVQPQEGAPPDMERPQG
jgi:hypothetical protein